MKGADGILVDEENRCPLTPTVSKTSAGALELIEVNCVKNPKDLLAGITKSKNIILSELDCKKQKWRIIVTTLDANNKKLQEVADLRIQPDV